MPNYWDDELSVLSTENVNFAVNTAGLGSRLVAVCIDLVLQMLTLLAFAILVLRYGELVIGIPLAKSWIAPLLQSVLILGIFLIFYAYFFLFEWLWNGLTPGKRLVGLRVLQINGLPATFWQVLVRNVLRIIDFLPMFYGVGAIAVIFSNQNRRLGDQAAGTIVARERHEEAASRVLDIHAAADAFLSAQQVKDRQTPSETSPAPPQKEAQIALTDDAYEMARDFLLRRQKLRPAPRARLAQLLAARIAQSINQPPPPAAQAESYLEYIVQNYSP